MNDVFKNIFRDRDFGGQGVKNSLEISFMEAVQDGTGVPPGAKPETCKACRGSGMIFMQNGPFRLQTTCSQCGGSGKTVKSLCKSCKGQRVIRGTKTIKAILGGTVQVPTLTGDVLLKVRPGTQPGQKVVLKGKGLKTRNSAFYGDQYVHFNVSIPTNLTQRQRMLIEEFAKEEQGEDDKGAAAAGLSG